MSLFWYSSSLRFPWRLLALHLKTIHMSPRLNKNYDYDLNDLIQFKKETDQVFGSERKLTKTGKLRKAKIDSKINEYLQVLSAYSNQHSDDYQMDPSWATEFDSVENYQEGQGQELARNQTSSVTGSSTKGQGQELARNQTSSVTGSSSNKTTRFRNKNQQQDTDCTTTEDIYIPKISAVPSSQTYVKKLQEKRQKMVTNNPEKESEIQWNFSTERGNDFSVNSLSKKTVSFDNETSNCDILIPKITPIPDEKIHFPTSLPVELPGSQSKTIQLQSFINPPIEPPSSFDIISRVPLFSNESTSWQTSADFLEFQRDIEQMELRYSPSVKTILSKTMPETNRFFLNRWRENMIKELGEEGFKKHQDASIRKGVNLHANIMEYLSKKPVKEIQIMPENEGHWESLQSVFKTVSGVAALEVEVFHSYLFYKGVFDCVGHYKDLLCIIDWKTSRKSRPLLKNTYDDPLQIVAYMGAINSNDRYIQKFGEINYGLIVVAYSDGSPAHIHLMNRTTCEGYWKDWTDRLYNFYQLTYTEKVGTRKVLPDEYAKKVAS